MPGFNYPSENGDCETQAFNEGKKIIANGGRIKPSPTADPLRKYRYLFEVMTIDQGNESPLEKAQILSLYMESCDRPKFEFDKITIHNGQDEIYRPGKSRWLPIKLSTYEVIDDSGYVTLEVIKNWRTKVLMAEKHGTLNRISDIHKTCRITMEDGLGAAVWRFMLYDCWISNMSPSPLSYSANELTSYELELTYNRAIDEQIVKPPDSLLSETSQRP